MARSTAQIDLWVFRDAALADIDLTGFRVEGPEDIAAVSLNAFAPHLLDWGMRAFLGAQQASDEMRLPRDAELERFPADAEPPLETA